MILPKTYGDPYKAEQHALRLREQAEIEATQEYRFEQAIVEFHRAMEAFDQATAELREMIEQFDALCASQNAQVKGGQHS